jgi:predicted Zn-dependent peptidase
VSTPGPTDGTIIREFLAEDFARGLGLLRDVVLEPGSRRTRSAAPREEQSRRIVAALEQHVGGGRQVLRRFLYGKPSLRRPVDGRIGHPSGARPRRRARLLRALVPPEQHDLVLVGDVVADEAVAAVRQAFGGWKPLRRRARACPPPAPLTARRVLLVDKPTPRRRRSASATSP